MVFHVHLLSCYAVIDYLLFLFITYYFYSVLQKQIKGAVTIAVTVGVPWIVGVMTFEPIALIGQWLFIILTGLQVTHFHFHFHFDYSSFWAVAIHHSHWSAGNVLLIIRHLYNIILHD